MAQITIRLDDDLAEACKQEAAVDGQSLNGWVVMVLRTKTDPAFTGPGVERTRERFRRAGILAEFPPSTKSRPPEDLLAQARKAGGRGTPSEVLIRQDRDGGP
jgi:hypothetical protein